jgi:hypothetical protein
MQKKQINSLLYMMRLKNINIQCSSYVKKRLTSDMKNSIMYLENLAMSKKFNKVKK